VASSSRSGNEADARPPPRPCGPQQNANVIHLQVLTMKILAFDTSSTRGSAALLEGSELRAEIRLNSLETHSAMLLSSVNFLLKSMHWMLEDLNLIASGIGPGSFTGIRIGAATAIGLAQSLVIPFAGISGLDALAFQASFLEGRIAAMLDARRSQAYYSEYVCSKGKVRQAQKPELISISDLECKVAGRHLYIVGDLQSCGIAGAAQHDSAWPRSAPVDLFLATAIGNLAFSKKSKWRSGASIIAEPMYIRPPDALKNKNRKY
jgi:tRNA threonylcarbamoyladenosine biosynthesis protein TsaB